MERNGDLKQASADPPLPEKQTLLDHHPMDVEKVAIKDGKAPYDELPPEKSGLLSEKQPIDFSLPPVDKWHFVYIILIIHGVGTLMPWNMYITAEAYFVDYKLAGNNTEAAVYRDYFLSFLGFVAQVPNVLLNGFNVFCHCRGGNTAVRIVWSIIIVVIMFIATVILAMIDSSEWPAGFFWTTMIIVVIINMANGVYQNSVYGTAAILPMKYTNAVVLGSNLSGTLTSILMIISISSTPDPRTSAIYYFLAAILVLLIAFDTYFALPLMPFFSYYQKKSEDSHRAQQMQQSAYVRPPFWKIFRQCFKHDLGVFYVFFVTLTCFPAIMAGVERSSDGFPVSLKYYTPVTCFLFFNLFAMLGNLTTEFIRKPGPDWVWIPIVLRGLFIPFFMFCNFRPEARGLPVYIDNDYVYSIGGILMAFTSGYFSSLTMMYAPREVAVEHQGTAGMMAAFFLILGIFSGVIFSLPVTLFIERVGWGTSDPSEMLVAFANATTAAP